MTRHIASWLYRAGRATTIDSRLEAIERRVAETTAVLETQSNRQESLIQAANAGMQAQTALLEVATIDVEARTPSIVAMLTITALGFLVGILAWQSLELDQAGDQLLSEASTARLQATAALGRSAAFGDEDNFRTVASLYEEVNQNAQVLEASAYRQKSRASTLTVVMSAMLGGVASWFVSEIASVRFKHFRRRRDNERRRWTERSTPSEAPR